MTDMFTFIKRRDPNIPNSETREHESLQSMHREIHAPGQSKLYM